MSTVLTASTDAPPRVAERLLDALGATATYRDTVLGDLAEEFACRVAGDGVPAARRWYWREALRTAPHLLGDWWRHLRPRGVADLVGVVVLAYLLLVILTTFVVTGIAGLTQTLGLAVDARPLFAGAAGLLTSGSTAFVGGYLAAWLGSREPIAAALTFGAPWVGLVIVNLTRVGHVPGSFVAAAALTIAGGTTLGGAYRVAAGAARVPPPG